MTPPLFTLAGILSTWSPLFAAILAEIAIVARSNLPILLVGPPGVGKSLVARAVHAASGRCRNPLVEQALGTLMPSLIEALLFGVVGGIASGVAKDRRGLFEQAHGGTLFLDEIDSCSGQVQLGLLRVLEEGRVRPVGAEAEITVDVRLVAATNACLTDAVDRGQFRADLLTRISGLEFIVPALRDRPEDVLPLAAAALEKFGRSTDLSTELTTSAVDFLRNHAWPGNVRELRRTIERGVALSEGRRICAEDLRPRIANYRPEPSTSNNAPAKRTRVDEELELAVKSGRAEGRSVRAVAKHLGISAATVHRICRRTVRKCG
ncbi:MAG: sigma 54-interacting transcriptional regulator [Polyangiaceae bacterium]